MRDDISLTPHEEAFVLNNFEAFAAHFKPTADSDRKALAAMYNENSRARASGTTVKIRPICNSSLILKFPFTPRIYVT